MLVTQELLLDQVSEPILKRQAGIFETSRSLGLDRAYEQMLLGLIDTSSLDAVLLLAMDYPYDEKGNCLKQKAKFFVPNDHVLDLAKKHSQIFSACSIHPARKDAIEELERCRAWSQSAQTSSQLPQPGLFGSSLSSLLGKTRSTRASFPAHTGGEFSVPVLNSKFADPRLLRLPLECGVTVIAAHGAGKSGLFDPDYTEDLLRMMKEFKRLFTDNSFGQSEPMATLPALLDAKVQDRVVHGSDFPIPSGGFGPWIGGLLSGKSYREARKIANPLERDCFIKQAVVSANRPLRDFRTYCPEGDGLSQVVLGR